MAGKRGQNEGSIVKRADGRWCAVLNLGYADGKRKRKYYYGKTRAEVATLLADAQHVQKQGIAPTDGRLTVRMFLSRWLDDKVKPSVAPSTYRSYKDTVASYINPAIGHIRLDKLAAADVQQMIARSLATKGVNATTARYHWRVLRTALNQAVRWSVVPRNVASLASPPRAANHQGNPFTPEEARVFLETIRDHKHEALFIVALTTGLRFGEALALQWTDIDTEAGTLSVRYQLQRRDGMLTLVETKTEKSRRTLPLPTLATDALQRHRERQQFAKRLVGARWQDTGFVFTTKFGTPLDQRRILIAFKRVLARANLADRRFHDLRGSAATLMLMQGVDLLTISRQLGHSTIATTAAAYAHVLPALQREAASKMDALLTGTE